RRSTARVWRSSAARARSSRAVTSVRGSSEIAIGRERGDRTPISLGRSLRLGSFVAGRGSNDSLRFRATYAAAAAALLLLVAAQAPEPRPFTFFVASDSHFGADGMQDVNAALI